ncbi:MAG TPA: hypothetical protein VJ506_04135 [Candidatus Limnocylindrales bacterium]|nr:hypothetical protein [Candidatus Limnocylindrales bacterium]
MKRLITLAGAAVLSLALAGPALAADPVRPFGGTVSGPDSYLAPDCPGAVWHYTSLASGEMLHLGRVSMAVSHCTWIDTFVDDAPATGHFGPGTMTFTAANGDTLVLSDWGTFRLVATPAGLFSYVDISWVVVDGTGRFGGASGGGGAAAITDIGANTTTATYRGTISY